MSKRLPYFQFEPAEYTSGDIITCSYAAQGVFAHLKALYWQRNCQLTLVKANKIIREDDLINELITEGVVKIDGDNIIINFLDEQLEEITKSKKRLSEAGKKGAEVKAALLAEKQATLKLPLSPAKATLQQLDKIRLDKSKEDNIIQDNITTEEINQINTVYKLYPSVCPYKGENLKPQKDREDIKRLILKRIRERKTLLHVTQPIRDYVNGREKSKGWHVAFKELLLDLPEYYEKKAPYRSPA